MTNYNYKENINQFLNYINEKGFFFDSSADISEGEDQYYYELDATRVDSLIVCLNTILVNKLVTVKEETIISLFLHSIKKETDCAILDQTADISEGEDQYYYEMNASVVDAFESYSRLEILSS